MRRIAISTALVVVGLAPASAQTVVPPPPAPVVELPGLGLPPEVMSVEPLPNGAAVSRPLRPVLDAVQIPAEPPPPQPSPTVQRVIEPGRPFGSTWYSGEFLLWWTKPERVPPLVTTNPMTLPLLNTPTTRVLFGGGTPDAPNTGGGRFVLGWGVGPGHLAGVEVGYQFLGTQTTTDQIAGGGGGRGGFIGRPVVNPFTGGEEVVLVTAPYQVGTVESAASIRVQGWELTGLANVYSGPQVRVHALAGYRYFMVNEGLRVSQATVTDTVTALPVMSTLPGFVPSVVRTATTDQFDAHNRFHGAQLGLRTELERGSFFAQLDTKVSLGRTVEVVRISGQTVTISDTVAGPAVDISPFGVLGQPTNAGRVARGVFSVLPEAGLRVGYKFGERSRFFVGYNFVYLSQAVRAADQIDRTVDLTQTFPPNPAALTLPATRPTVPFDRSDFWVQGLSFGLEWRY
jgi:hypothetical protein